MSKHFKTSLTRDRHGRMAQLRGDPVGDIETIRKAYTESLFYYQFISSDGHSRVLRCSTAGELEFLIRQVRAGARIIIQHNSEPRPAYHYDPAFRPQLQQPAH